MIIFNRRTNEGVSELFDQRVLLAVLPFSKDLGGKGGNGCKRYDIRDAKICMGTMY
jgi:hypothetical protein